MLAAMDAAGVTRTVLVQASTCYGHDNSYVANAVAAHPDRFTGVGSVDTLESDAVAVLKHWLESGITGLRIFTTGSNMGGQQLEILDDSRSFPVWEYAQQIDLPICLQMQAKALPQVEMLALRFPRVRILLDHFARPDLADGPPYARAASVWALARFPNIYLKASPHTFAAAKTGQATPASFFRRAVDAFGAKRIFWGSNFPAAEGTLASLLALARENFATLTADEQDWIFSKTALSLYPALGK
jgi:predicted TIM-barrel fold metal-dependent hydrolase